MWIKICGITRTEDALVVAGAGANAIGLNFYHGSRRCVSLEQASQICRAVRLDTGGKKTLDLVGVFVNSPLLEIVETVGKVGLTAVQFHGDESHETVTQFCHMMPGIHVIRAFRVSAETIDVHLDLVDRLQSEVSLAACLLDAFVPGEFGGTGVTLDQRVAERYLAKDRPRLILAGGLTPGNVSRVVLGAAPWGVDTASGVESSPGIKDAEKCRSFVASAVPDQGQDSSEVRL
jgi:phosphoribosylanthranilate isomerase